MRFSQFTRVGHSAMLVHLTLLVLGWGQTGSVQNGGMHVWQLVHNYVQHGVYTCMHNWIAPGFFYYAWGGILYEQQLCWKLITYLASCRSGSSVPCNSIAKASPLECRDMQSVRVSPVTAVLSPISQNLVCMPKSLILGSSRYWRCLWYCNYMVDMTRDSREGMFLYTWYPCLPLKVYWENHMYNLHINCCSLISFWSIARVVFIACR
jgi:hypothetical protein